MCIVDDATRYIWTFGMKNVTDAASTLRKWLRTEVRQLNPDNTGPSVQSVRCDSGPEFASGEFAAVLEDNSITWEPSCSDASQQRGVAERAIGTVTTDVGGGFFRSVVRRTTQLSYRSMWSSNGAVVSYVVHCHGVAASIGDR